MAFARQLYKEMTFQGKPCIVEVLQGNDAINAVLDGESKPETQKAFLEVINKGGLIVPKGAFIYDAETFKHVGVIQ